MIKQELINKYNLTESQYKYELTRSQKSNIHISKWLKRKYEFYHYTSGSKLNKIFSSEKLIGCNISNQEIMVWFSNDDYTPASTFNFKINNTNLKDWWKENSLKKHTSLREMSFHQKEMNGFYRFVFFNNTFDRVNYIGSDLQIAQKKELFKKGHHYKAIYANEYERFVDTTLGEDLECWSYSKENSVSLKHSVRLEKLTFDEHVFDHETFENCEVLNLPLRLVKKDSIVFQCANYPLLTDIIKECTDDAEWKEVDYYHSCSKRKFA